MHVRVDLFYPDNDLAAGTAGADSVHYFADFCEREFIFDGWANCAGNDILDGFSRYIIAWKLCTTIWAKEVTATIEMTLEVSALVERPGVHRPRLLSGSSSSYIAGDLDKWLHDRGIGQIRGALNLPQTQGKIGCRRQTLENRIFLANYYLPTDLHTRICDFLRHYNHRRYHGSLGNLPPVDVYCGRGQTVPKKREAIK